MTKEKVKEGVKLGWALVLFEAIIALITATFIMPIGNFENVDFVIYQWYIFVACFALVFCLNIISQRVFRAIETMEEMGEEIEKLKKEIKELKK